MKTLIVPVLLGVFIGGVSINIRATEELPANTISLMSQEGKCFPVPQDVATLSKTIKNMVEDRPGKGIYYVGKIRSETLNKILLPLMQFAYSIQHEPFAVRLNKMTSKMKDLLSKRGLQAWEDLLHNISSLDIRILKTPLANGMIQKIYQMKKGDKKQIKTVVSDIYIPDGFKRLLAKYWYLNYGTYKNYILPDLDYSFSIEELLAFKKLPKAIQKTLSLENLRINDLVGLHSIPDIASIKGINLSYNQIKGLQDGTFNGFNNLQWLALSDNQINELQQGAFNGLNNLQELDLSDNRLTKLREGASNDFNNLSKFSLSGDKLPELPQCALNCFNNPQEFSLFDNKLPELRENVLSGFNSMQEFLLSENRVAKLQQSALNRLGNLQLLDFSGNRLTSAAKEELRQQFGNRVRY